MVPHTKIITGPNKHTKMTAEVEVGDEKPEDKEVKDMDFDAEDIKAVMAERAASVLGLQLAANRTMKMMTKRRSWFLDNIDKIYAGQRAECIGNAGTTSWGEKATTKNSLRLFHWNKAKYGNKASALERQMNYERRDDKAFVDCFERLVEEGEDDDEDGGNDGNDED